MRLLYVVQRYGESIAGGAEQHCREMAERMARRGHHVDVATTTAQSYVDWANVYPPGRSVINDVLVHRFLVKQPRISEISNDLNRRMVRGPGTRALRVQREWMRIQGPYSPDLPRWLERNASRFDVVIFFTYLYWPTWAGLTAIAGTVPTVLHPTVHDEPPVRLSLFNEMFRKPDAFALSAPEEIELIERRFRFTPEGAVVGIGTEPAGADPGLFREQFPMDGDPYLLYVGRLDPGKGVGELANFFVAYKERNPGPLRLVMLGDPLMQLPQRDDIVVTGFVDYDVRDSALAGAWVFTLPSFFESFSMVLTEAFAHRVPALVQGKCEVLRGHARRSGAAIPYEGFAEFECTVEMLRDDPDLVARMGQAGFEYVNREYTWDIVLDRYESLLEQTAALHCRT